VTFLKLKPLTQQHLSAVLELDQLCFGGLWSQSGYERELASPNSQLLILEAASEKGDSGWETELPEVLTQTSHPTAPIPSKALLGLGCYWSIVEEAHITILAVHPNYQCQGLGQLLLYALLRDAKQRQLERATLEVKPSNQAALSLYQKFGFAQAGRRRRYYQDTGEDALILWRGGLQKPDFEETLTTWHQQIEQRLSRSGFGWSDG
jgi:ribosomal-protein-alanine N-acetyltransferase